MFVLKRPTILFISYDWNNIFKTDPTTMINKTKRDNWSIENTSLVFFCWSGTSYETSIHPNIHTIHRKAWVPITPLLELWSILYIPYTVWKFNLKPDALMAGNQSFLLSGILLRIFTKTRIILRMGGFPDTMAKTRNFSNLRLIHQKVIEILTRSIITDCVVVNKGLREYAISMGLSPDKIKIINTNTISSDQKFIDQADSSIVRKAYGLEGKKIILSVGRLEAEKNYDTLISHMSHVNNTYVLLLLSPAGGLLKDKLTQLAKDLNISEKVVFAGPASREYIWNYYKAADVFVLISKSEGVANVMKEAMYANVPVVGSRVGGILENIGQNLERGWLLNDSSDPEEFFRVINAINPKDKRVARAYRYVLEKLSHTQSMESLLNID